MSLAVWGEIRCVGSRGGCFGAGLSIHQQARFQGFNLVAVSLVVFGLFILLVILYRLGHIDPIDFYRKIHVNLFKILL